MGADICSHGVAAFWAATPPPCGCRRQHFEITPPPCVRQAQPCQRSCRTTLAARERPLGGAGWSPKSHFAGAGIECPRTETNHFCAAENPRLLADLDSWSSAKPMARSPMLTISLAYTRKSSAVAMRVRMQRPSYVRRRSVRSPRRRSPATTLTSWTPAGCEPATRTPRRSTRPAGNPRADPRYVAGSTVPPARWGTRQARDSPSAPNL